MLGAAPSRAASRCSASLRLRPPHLPAGLRPSGRPFASLAPLARPPAAVAPEGGRLGGAVAPPRRPLLGRAPCRARSLATSRGSVCLGSVVRPRRSRAVRPRGTLLGRGLPPSGASSALGRPRGKRLCSLGQSGRGSAASRRGLGFFACLGYLRAFAPGVLLPLPPAPSPRAGGGRSQGHTLCALATLRLAPCPALPSAFAAARYARGRNAPHAGMRAPAYGLRAQARYAPHTALLARHFCLPRVFAPFGHICPAAFNGLWVPCSLSFS